MPRNLQVAALLALLLTCGCMHSLNRVEPGGPDGHLAGTRASLKLLSNGTRAAITGEDGSGQKYSFGERAFLPLFHAAIVADLPGTFTMDVINSDR
jgi:hypothetical protein